MASALSVELLPRPLLVELGNRAAVLLEWRRAAASGPGAGLSVEGAVRTYACAFEAGGLAVSCRFVQFARRPTAADFGALGRPGGVERIALADAFDRLASHPDVLIGLVRSLAEVVIGLLQLARDAEFARSLAELIAEHTDGGAPLSLHGIAGSKTVVADAVDARIPPGSLLIIAGEGVHTGRFLASGALDRANVAALSGPLQPAGHALLVDETSVRGVRLDTRIASGPAAFVAAHAETAPHLSRTMLAYAEAAFASGLEAALRVRPLAPVAARSPGLDVTFNLDTAVPVAAGLFLAGWYRDPEGRIAAVEVDDPSLPDAAVDIATHAFPGRAEIDGRTAASRRFAAFLPRRSGAGRLPQPIVRVRLAGGERLAAVAPMAPADPALMRHEILGSIREASFTTAMLDDAYRPAVGELTTAIAARQAIERVRDFGPPPARMAKTPAVSIVVPLYRNLSFLRSQLFAFAADRFVREQCQLVYVLDDPPSDEPAAALVEGLALTTGLRIRLVTLAINGGYALANNLGVGEASGAALVLMNSDVVPTGPRWLQPMLETLKRRRRSVVGPKLIYADGTLQHAGLYFRTLPSGFWQNMHYYKGYSGRLAAASVSRRVPGVTGACMMLRRADFEAVGGFTTDYVIGDYEDSDLCLKLGERGGGAWYVAEACLQHFERQSVAANAHHTDGGSTVYNRALHHDRWAGRIAATMARFPAPPAG